jgi:DNA-binding response OmpR family regulator
MLVIAQSGEVACLLHNPLLEDWGNVVAKTVLIVEDERLLAKTLSTALKEAGYDAVVTHSAEQAEKKWLEQEPFDLVILDNRLPKRTGLELLRSAREQGRAYKVILMTAFDNRDVKTQARQLEVDEYFSKPFDLSKMIRTVDNLIGDPGNGRR